ncbi:MAG: M20/M25/M40 family metallo-hydrolase [Sphaerochaeta sp.]|jgi:tripeptide aminopeptidase|nr:M20/M25/M40 family metallo-hydrolase [Sphaerochaeta sp.]
MHTLVDLFLELVSIDSPSYGEDRLALFLEHQLLKLGCTTAYDGAGNLYAHLPGIGEAVLFNAHMDTVTLAVGAKPIVSDGIIKTDGTTALGADDKAAIAAILWALRRIREGQIAHPPLSILFTVAEEEGLVGASKVDLALLGPVHHGYTLDVTGSVGTAVVQAAWHDMIEATFTGRAAHAGFEPEKGVSAIMMASRAIDRMRLLRIDEETTANVGSFIAAGAKNIVSEQATVVFEARSLNERKLIAQIEDMKDALGQASAFYGGGVAIKHTPLYSGYRHEEESPVLRNFFEACARLSLPFATKTTLGGSDANILNARGIPTLAVASGYRGAHSTSEEIPVAELEALATLTLELMKS